MKPKLMNLWKAFPDHTQYRTLKDLYEMLGGTVEKILMRLGLDQTEIPAPVE